MILRTLSIPLGLGCDIMRNWQQRQRTCVLGNLLIRPKIEHNKLRSIKKPIYLQDW